MKRGWLKQILEADEDEDFYRDHPEMSRNSHWYAMAPFLGVVSLSFSLGWTWGELVGAVLGVAFLGLPGALAAIFWWSKKADESQDDPARRRWLLVSGIAMLVVAVVVWYRVFSGD